MSHPRCPPGTSMVFTSGVAMQHPDGGMGPTGADEENERLELLLEACRNGDRAAFDRLFDLLYDELRVIARRHLRQLRGSSGQTLNTTALVHESYLKLADGAVLRGRARAQFFAVASRAMRSILVDHARRRGAEKRGGHAVRITLQEYIPEAEGRSADLLALDDALGVLAAKLPRLERIVECRFFGGMSVKETAEALDLSVRTVERDWTRARAYLVSLVQVDDSGGDATEIDRTGISDALS